MPSLRFAECGCVNTVNTAAALDAVPDQAGITENPQVLGEARRRQIQRFS